MLLSEEKHGDKSQPIRAVSPARNEDGRLSRT